MAAWMNSPPKLHGSGSIYLIYCPVATVIYSTHIWGKYARLYSWQLGLHHILTLWRAHFSQRRQKTSKHKTGNHMAYCKVISAKEKKKAEQGKGGSVVQGRVGKTASLKKGGLSRSHWEGVIWTKTMKEVQESPEGSWGRAVLAEGLQLRQDQAREAEVESVRG